MSAARRSRVQRVVRAIVHRFDREEVRRVADSRFLPAGYEPGELNERIRTAKLWLFTGCMTAAITFFIGTPLLVVSTANAGGALTNLIIPSFVVGAIGFLIFIIAVTPLSRRLARSIVRKELRTLGVRVCECSGYDCRGIQSVNCPECGNAVVDATS